MKKIEKGMLFAHLTAVEYKKIDGIAKWKCECFCGNVKYVRSAHLISGKTKSCGCMSSAIRNDSFYVNQAIKKGSL